MKILLATSNPGKINSYRQIFEDLDVEIVTLGDLNIADKFEENGSTFEENARNKAIFYYHLAKIPTLADDGGLEIDYFKGEPGVRSRRWLGYEATDQEIVDYLKKIIPTIPQNQRSARFIAVTCLVKSEKEIYLAKNTKEGSVTEDIRDNFPAGLPYRSCFFIKEFNKHIEDLNETEKAQISHRRKNVEEIIRYL